MLHISPCVSSSQTNWDLLHVSISFLSIVMGKNVFWPDDVTMCHSNVRFMLWVTFYEFCQFCVWRLNRWHIEEWQGLCAPTGLWNEAFPGARYRGSSCRDAAVSEGSRGTALSGRAGEGELYLLPWIVAPRHLVSPVSFSRGYFYWLASLFVPLITVTYFG